MNIVVDSLRDVVVIGGGVVGTAIVRALSLYNMSIMLVEKQHDVCEGTSKANSAIIHTGFDAKPGSVESDCLRRSRELWPELIGALKIPFLPCGAVMVAASETEKAKIIEHYVPNAEANGVEVRYIEKEELLEMNPDVSEHNLGGLVIEGEGICDPFWVTRAFAQLAELNGAEIRFGSGVERIEPADDDSHLVIVLEDGSEIRTRYAVNAAGLWSDEIADMVKDESFVITPRKGQFILTEDTLGISQIVLPVPSPSSKGILAAPVVFGGFLLGPTAEDQEDKWDRSTTDDGMEAVLNGVEKLLPGIRSATTIRQFAGLRAVCSTGDFVISPSPRSHRLIHAAGIRSTGLSSSPGIAERVVELLRSTDLIMTERSEAILELPDLLGESDAASNGEIICLCRSITRGEIERALSAPLSSTTLDGIKRRTGAMLGECQGNGCIPKLLDVMESFTASRGLAKAGGEEAPLKGLRESYIAGQAGGRDNEI
ncbi:FAD-dependent oxidoreductase [Paenibacillus mendelii]|nr:FAD-dependent oxidoreductase [Paenibacillus mendelii]